MRNRKPRRFNRHRSNGRGHHGRNNERDQIRLGAGVFSNGRSRNNFKPQQSAEKLAEKYNAMAKEALSSGDKILSENYFQHADHFMRIIDERNLNQSQNKINTNQETKDPNPTLPETDANKQDSTVKEKKE